MDQPVPFPHSLPPKEKNIDSDNYVKDYDQPGKCSFDDWTFEKEWHECHKKNEPFTFKRPIDVVEFANTATATQLKKQMLATYSDYVDAELRAKFYQDLFEVGFDQLDSMDFEAKRSGGAAHAKLIASLQSTFEEWKKIDYTDGPYTGDDKKYLSSDSDSDSDSEYESDSEEK